MKKINIEIKDTNMEDKINAYALTRSSQGVSAKKMVGKKFKLKNYVFYSQKIEDLETGEVVQQDCVTLETTEGEIIGTNSQVLSNALKDIINLIKDFNLEIDCRELVIVNGQGKTGNTFNTIEFSR